MARRLSREGPHGDSGAARLRVGSRLRAASYPSESAARLGFLGGATLSLGPPDAARYGTEGVRGTVVNRLKGSGPAVGPDSPETPMTEPSVERLTAIRQRCAAATPGPWACWNVYPLADDSRDLGIARI